MLINISCEDYDDCCQHYEDIIKDVPCSEILEVNVFYDKGRLRLYVNGVEIKMPWGVSDFSFRITKC